MKKIAISLLAATLAIPVGAVQQAPRTPPAFRSATDVVEVDVVVQDRTGRFVSDLKPEDFEVREEGRPQKIDLFYFIEGNTRTTTGVGLAGPDGGAPMSSPAARPPRIFVAFFDDEHLTPGGFKRVQAAAVSLFSKQFKDGDVGGVVRNGQMVNNRLTIAGEELLKAVRDATPNSKSSSRIFEQRQWPSLTDVEAIRIAVRKDEAVRSEAVRRACTDEPTLCHNAELAVRGKAAQLADETRATTTQTVRSMLALLNGLSRIEGRKTVLLLSEGFLADESWPLVKDTVGAAARANARLYTLDARGLERYGMADRLSGSDPGADDGVSRLLGQLDMASDSVNSLAVDTGGFVVRNTNIFDDAVAQIASDASTYYVLGYRPDATPDGKFRRLEVRVNRPGVVVRARRGYVANVKPVSTATPTALPPSEVNTTSIETPLPSTNTARPDPVEGRASESTSGARLRPDAAKHVETLGPNAASDADAESGWEAYKRGDVETARRALAIAAARPSAAPWVYYALGQSDYALSRHHDAVNAWEKVRSTNPEFEPVYFDLVDGYLQLKDYDKAIRVLRAARDRWPGNPEVFNALGVVQVARGSLDDAVESFERAIAAAPTEGTAYFNLGKACELRYWKSRRYVVQTRQWMANGNDKTKAIDNYKRYLATGGPFENAAREGLSRLGWTNP